LGIRASPTCVLDYDGATGFLVGEENRGMAYMFTMMNNARLSVGLQGLAVGDRAYQMAVQYAQERQQGRAVGAPAGEQSLIIEHPDVRRMLLTMKAQLEALRCLIYATAQGIDVAHRHADEHVRTAAQERVDLLIPVCKGWGTDLGVDVTSTAIQVFGGMGYVEETGVAQHFRDARIAPIYEGTNGIQAMDLVGRKLPMRAGGVVKDLLADIGATVERGRAAGADHAVIADRLADALAALTESTDWLMANGLEDVRHALAGATPYLRQFGIVMGGWLLAESALTAGELEVGDGGGFDEAFLAAKRTTARFYATQLLPQAGGLTGAVTAGFDDLMALAPAQF
ncbi:MAG TPA: acyl-CoA dehydrogenase, partial [Acidimicrobiales bacterium]|nr:acyl-CoA dehydrogenase [Acidimicrobiales bacterium]